MEEGKLILKLAATQKAFSWWQLHIHDIITATFNNLLEMEKHKFVQKACKLTLYFLKYMVNGDRLPEKYKHSFLSSYVYLEGICYTDDTVEESRENVHEHMAQERRKCSLTNFNPALKSSGGCKTRL